jgi:hypothetical protein
MLDDLGMAHHLFYRMKLGKYSLLVLDKESPRRTQNMIRYTSCYSTITFMGPSDDVISLMNNGHIGSFSSVRVCINS